MLTQQYDHMERLSVPRNGRFRIPCPTRHPAVKLPTGAITGAAEPINQKRAYRSSSRALCRKRTLLSKISEGWKKNEESLVDTYIRSRICCSSLQCFKAFGVVFLREKMPAVIVKSPRSARRVALTAVHYRRTIRFQCKASV